MGTGYNKTDPTNFVDGETIQASDFTTEFNAIDSAFETTGHQHDGTDGEGGAIEKLLSNTITFGTGADTDVAVTFDGNSSDGVLTWMEDEDYFKFSDDILMDTTEKLQFRDTALYINSSADGQLDLVADTLVKVTGSFGIGSGATVTTILDEDTLSTNSDTALATQQSIKAYVDSQVTAQDLDFQGDSGGALSIDLDSESLTIAGGTGIDTTGATNTLTVAIDSTVATLSGVQTLTNKSIDAGQLTGTVNNARLDAELQALAGLTSAADKGIQFTGSGTAATYDLTTAGKALLDDANASAQRTTLGLAIGTDVQAYDAELAAIAGLTSAADKGIQFTGSGTAATFDLTAAGKALLDDADASAQRTTLGLGTIATQAANSVSITGGSVTGITDIAVADGGTGASTASAARTNLGVAIGSDVQAFDADNAVTDAAQTFTVSQRGTITTDNDLSFDLNATNNFKCTPSGTGTLTFTNHTAGQSGNILLINTGGHAISLASTTKGDANLATTISTAGTYWLSYYDDGTNAYVVTSAAFA